MHDTNPTLQPSQGGRGRNISPSRRKIWPVLAALGLVFMEPSSVTADSLSIDVSAPPVKTLKRPLLGENTTWLLSSDLKYSPARNVPMAQRMHSIGGGIARYPYGALAQNYRWHTPRWDSVTGKYDYSDAVNGLKPRVVSLTGPGNWTWAVSPDGTFPEAADFDEFISQCRYAGMEPLVVINVLAHKQFAPGDPVISQLGMPGPLTENQMVEEAAAWVHYANVVRGYGVKYWAIGNEIEGPETTDLITKTEYIRIFKKICHRMKQIDPTVLTTPGTFQNTGWLEDLFSDTAIVSGYGTRVSKDYMDFIVTHQYLFDAVWAETQASWQSYSDDPIPKITGVNSWINSKNWGTGAKPDLLVTEVGITGMNAPEDVETTQMGLKFAAKTTQRYLTLAANGDALVFKGDPATDSEIMDMVAVPGKLGYTTIRAMSGTSTQYLRAAGTGSPVRFDGNGTTTSCNWRRWRGKDACYFESEAYPGYYLKVKLTDNTLVLANSGVLDNAGQAITLEARRFTTAQIQNGYYLWNNPSERLMKSYPWGRILGYNSSTGQIEARRVRGEPSNEFKFVMENVAFIDSTSREVKIRVVGAPGPNNYLRTTGTPPNLTVDAGGTGLGVASIWIYQYTNLNAAGDGIGSQFRLESKGFPGQFLLFEGTGPGTGLITAAGTSATGDNGIFSMPTLPPTWSDTYPTPPVTKNEKDALANDHYKSLIWADMLLASLKLNRVTSMVHWNTLSAWNGKYGKWGQISDSLEPAPDLGFTPVGKVQRLINLLATGRVINHTSNTSNAMRVYSCLDEDRGRLIVFALNKATFSKVLTLSFTGTSPFSPGTMYDACTYASATSDQEDISPATTYASGLAIPANATFTIPRLCLQVLIFTDPAKAKWPVSLLERALNPSSTMPTAKQPDVSIAGDSKLQLSFFRARPQLTYEVLGSSNLLHWTVVATNPGAIGETVTVPDTATISSGSRRFLFLRVTSPTDF